MKTKHYIYIAVVLLIIAVLTIPAWAKNTSHIHTEDGTIIDGDASYSDFACAYWKAKLFKKGGICKQGGPKHEENNQIDYITDPQIIEKYNEIFLS